jgi:hypothetical protein
LQNCRKELQEGIAGRKSGVTLAELGGHDSLRENGSKLAALVE